MKAIEIVRTVAVEVVLLPIQIVIVTAMFFPVMAIGALIYLIHPRWTDIVFRCFIQANDAFNRFRLRLCGDPKWTTYNNLKPPNKSD